MTINFSEDVKFFFVFLKMIVFGLNVAQTTS